MSKTINQMKADYQELLRDKISPGSISRIDDAGMRDAVVNEIRDRGMISIGNTAALASQSYQNSRLVLIPGEGIFRIVETVDTPDNDTTFASSDIGYLWELMLDLKGGVRWFRVGVTPGAPSPGENTWTNKRFKNRFVLLIVGGLILPLLDPEDSSPWVEKDIEDEQLIVHNYTFDNNQQIGFIS